MQVTAEVLVERRSELAISGEPPELNAGADFEQDIAECVGQTCAHCRLQLRYLTWIRRWHGYEWANVVLSCGQDLMHFGELG
jgi:hypothetical protein